MNMLEKESFNPDQKQEIPQVGPTGMSQDYINEIAGLYSFINDIGLEAAINIFDKIGIKKYLERYPVGQYENIQTEENTHLIERLDELVGELRTNFQNRTITKEKFNILYDEINSIVRI
jgi:hypothetical protein